MNILIKLIRKLFFNRRDDIKRIEESKKELHTSNDFKENMKINNINSNRFNNLEVLKCVGNGLGISDTIEF